LADGYRFRVAQTRARTVPGLLGGAGRATCDCEGQKPPAAYTPLSPRVASCVRAIWCWRGFEPPAGWLCLSSGPARPRPPYVRQVFDRRPRCQGRVTITVPRVSYRGSFPFGQSARGRFYGPDLLVIFLLVRTERTLVLVTDTNRNIRVRVLKKKVVTRLRVEDLPTHDEATTRPRVQPERKIRNLFRRSGSHALCRVSGT
jgi:hypothetical protein